MTTKPTRAVTPAITDQWAKVAALVMFKLGIKDLVITPADIAACDAAAAFAISYKETDTALEIVIATKPEAPVAPTHPTAPPTPATP